MRDALGGGEGQEARESKRPPPNEAIS
jgi:hypothetical protein